MNSTNWSFEIQPLPPFTLTVFSPLSQIYGVRRVLFNMTTNVQAETIEFINYDSSDPEWGILCLECTGYGDSEIRSRILLEGNNSLSFRATDVFGQIREVNVSLFIDSIAPRITSTFPKRGKYTNGSMFFVRYSEDFLENITLFLDNELIAQEILFIGCPSGGYQACGASIDVSAYDGQAISYYFDVRDLVRNKSSRVTNIFVDTTSPILQVHNPLNASLQARRVDFNMSASEQVIFEYYDADSFFPRWRRLCNGCLSYGFENVKTKLFSSGTHHLTFRARDKAGNSDEESIVFDVV
jgi:hypothetical protein